MGECLSHVSMPWGRPSNSRHLGYHHIHSTGTENFFVAVEVVCLYTKKEAYVSLSNLYLEGSHMHQTY
jgi:hypothetical protein